MKFEVTLDGETRTVDVRRTAAGRYDVAVDDAEARSVSARRVGPTSMVLEGTGPRRVRADVALDGESVFVRYRDQPLRGEAVDPRKHALDLAGGGNQGRIVSQMPGAVVRVVVAEGDAVAEGDVLIVVEAMKMENEFKAPFDGVVAAVPVAAGQAIESGALLMELTPNDG